MIYNDFDTQEIQFFKKVFNFWTVGKKYTSPFSASPQAFQAGPLGNSYWSSDSGFMVML